MPRSETARSKNTTSSYPMRSYDVVPRGSYTGPIMPRPTMGQTVKDGFSFGIGTNIANRVMNSFFGSPKVSETTSVLVVNSTDSSSKSQVANESVDFVGKAPMDVQIAYQQCMKEDGNHEKCKDYLI